MSLFIAERKPGRKADCDNLEEAYLEMAPSSPQVDLKKIQFNGEPMVINDSTKTKIEPNFSASIEASKEDGS